MKKKTLFQLIAEKVKAASRQVGRPLPLAMMTSPLNHVESETFFVQNVFFGLSPAQTRFFYQRMWPLLDFEGNLFLQAPDAIARGPNGNGGVFRRMVEIGLWKKWKELGVEMVNVIAVDNPLALPIDYELFGFHARHGCDVSVKAATRRGPEEEVGVLSLVNGKPAVLEYTEHQLGEEYNVANLGLYCFSMDFIEEVSEVKMPLHRAKKAAKTLGSESVPEKPNAWKFEEFIFDVLPMAKRCEALLYPRESCFAPLKNLCGADSIESVQEALLASDRRIFKQVTGVEPPSDVIFELSSEFYYPTEEFLEKWKGKSLPEESYIK